MRFVETPVFTRAVTSLLSDEEYRQLQLALLIRPEQGALIRGSGGLRKLRPASSSSASGTGGVSVRTKEFDALVTSIRQAGTIRRGGRRPSRVFDFKREDVRAIRANLGKSQNEFALLIGVSVATLRNWEQGRRIPEGPARALLRVAAANPRAVIRALGA